MDGLGRRAKAIQLSHGGKRLDVSKIEFVVHGHGLSRHFAVAQHASNDQNIAIHGRDFNMYKTHLPIASHASIIVNNAIHRTDEASHHADP
ncbi:hypothetical protein D3C87_1691530 [compost metagenome]